MVSNGQHCRHGCELGRLFLKNNIGLVYGGGDQGIMGKIAQVVSEGGGKVTGVIPDFLLKDGFSGRGPGETVILDSMHTRKQFMCNNADAFIALPGGFGTMEELLEIITWVQLGIHNKPVGILNVNDYFKGFLDWVAKAREEGMIYGESKPFFVVASTPSELLDKLENLKANNSK